MGRLRAHCHPFADEQLSYADTGHVIQLPFEPTTTFVTGPGIGGTAKGAARASRDHWPKLLQFLDRSLIRGRESIEFPRIGNVFLRLSNRLARR